MVYVKTVTTPANTQKSTPLRSEIKAISGVIYQFDLYFPPGSYGLAGVKVWNANVALFPIDRDEWFIGDNATVRFDEIRELAVAENVLDVYTYNEDDTYEHVIQVRIGIATAEQWEARFAPGVALGKLNEAIAEILPKAVPQPFEADTSVVDALSSEG